MVVLFRTSLPPVSYRAPICSLSAFFRLLCILINFVVPIIICVFYYFHLNQYSEDQEFPIFTPKNIEYLSFMVRDTANNNQVYSVTFPTEIGLNPIFRPTLDVVQNTNANGNVESATIRATIGNLPKTTEIFGISCIFSYQVKLSNWARSTTQAYAAYSQSFPLPLEKFSVDGYLVLEQTEAVDFRGTLPNDVTNTMNPINLKNLITAQQNLSSTYGITWHNYISQPSATTSGSTYTFSADINIKITNVSIIHSLPLISIIESIIIIYLSTYILCSIILGAIQRYVYRRGVLYTVRDQHFASTVNSALKKLSATY